MDITIGKFLVALSITFSLFMLFGHGSSTAAGTAMQSASTASVESMPTRQIAPTQATEYHSASGEGQFMANGQLVGGR